MKADAPPPLVSLCIPTKNRADALDQCLHCIFSAEHYDSRLIEVVVSDNASTDNTQQVVEKYQRTQQNIVYNRNKENLGVGGELNFIKVLSLGKGRLLKLVNDYTLLKDQAIEALLHIVRTYGKEQYPVVFVPARRGFQEHIVATMGEMVEHTKEHITWIGAHAYWKEKWDALPDKTTLIDSCFMQTDWLFRLVRRGEPIIVEEGAFFGKLVTATPLGGYDWFSVQLANFIDIHEPYVRSGDIGKASMDVVMRAVYKSRVSEFKAQFFFRPANKAFDNGKMWDVVGLFHRYYKGYWWFWLHFPLYLAKLYVKKWVGYWWLKRRLSKH